MRKQTIREGSLFHRWIWRLQHRRQGRCVRVCVCEGSSKKPSRWKRRVPQMSCTPSPPFLSHPMFVFVDSVQAHYHLTESASSHSAWMDPISVLTVQKYFSWLRWNLWAHIRELTSECILVQPCWILPFVDVLSQATRGKLVTFCCFRNTD